MSRLDYASISVLIFGSSVPPIWYAFACESTFWARNAFLFTILTSSTVCLVMSMLPTFQTPMLRNIRAGMYIALGLSAAVPMIYIKFIADENNVIDSGAFNYILGGVIYILGAALYALRVPERWYPKQFDLIGNSHNIFHCLVVLALSV